MTRIALRGLRQAIESVLDWCHVHCEVSGVVDTDDQIELAVAGAFDPAAVPAHGAEIEILPDVATPTGLEHDVPIFVGDRIVVRPPWVAGPPDFAGITLIVPRGGAFGSGEHGSTRAALLVLDRLWPAEPLTVADVGTGSGILALFAYVRGARRVVACDLDPAAVAAARALVRGLRAYRGGPEALAGAVVDTLIANLAAAELDDALADLLRVWSRRGPLVLSGMRSVEVARIAARVPARPAARIECDGFVGLGYRGA